MILLRLFAEFFFVGLFAVGGGLATIPFLRDISVRTGWYTLAQLADMIAISESTPGPIGVNMASYAGYVTAGIPGVLTATAGIVTPSVIVILILARVLRKFRDSGYVAAAFKGLRPASLALITAAGIEVFKIALLRAGAPPDGGILGLLDLKAVILLAALLALTNVFRKIHPVAFIALAAAVGVAFRF
jgi:chromate transporter